MGFSYSLAIGTNNEQTINFAPTARAFSIFMHLFDVNNETESESQHMTAGKRLPFLL